MAEYWHQPAIHQEPTLDEVIAKIRDYFAAGVLRVWLVHHNVRQVYVYDAPNRNRILMPEDVLDGEDILPDLRLPLAELFEDAEDA